MERSLVLIKPDAVQRGLIGCILMRLEQRGLKFVAMKMIQIDRKLAEKHYDVHRDKPFFEGLISFITSSPVIAIVIEGNNVVKMIRRMMGDTNPLNSAPGTIRGDFAILTGQDPTHNLIHGSDSPENAVKEIKLFFDDDELCSYRRDLIGWF
jgi:nucleoside-diphosphate kinase